MHDGNSMLCSVAVAGVVIGALLVVPAPSRAQERGGPTPGAPTFHRYDDQLGRWIERVQTEHPALQAVRGSARALERRGAQAAALPDPQLTARWFAREPETRVGPQELSLEWMQGLPWKGKRSLLAERADRMAESVAWDAVDLERNLVARLKRAYFEAGYLQEALRINAEEQELLRRFESIALRRYSTGGGIQQNVIKVQTDLTRLADRATALRQQLDLAGRRIAELLGTPDAELAFAPIVLQPPDFTFDREALESAATQAHAAVRAVEKRSEADATWLKRQSLESKPDFQVGIGYTFVGNRNDLAAGTLPPPDNGKDIVALTVGVRLPLYAGRIHAARAEAEEQRAAGLAQVRAARNGVQRLVQESALRLDALRERAELHHDVLIPQAEESLASAEAAYSNNRLGFLDLLDAERVLFEIRLNHRRLVADYWTAAADLEYAAGQAFPAEPGEVR